MAGATAPAGPPSLLAASSTMTHRQMKTNLAFVLVVRVGPSTLPAALADDLHLSSTDSKLTAKPNSTVKPHIEKAFAKNMSHTLPNKSALLLQPNKLARHKKKSPRPIHTSPPTPCGAASHARAWTFATARASLCLRTCAFTQFAWLAHLTTRVVRRLPSRDWGRAAPCPSRPATLPACNASACFSPQAFADPGLHAPRNAS